MIWIIYYYYSYGSIYKKKKINKKKKRTKQDILSQGRNYYDTQWNGKEIFCVYRDLEVKTFLPHIRWHELDVDEQMMQKTQQLTDVQGQLK